MKPSPELIINTMQGVIDQFLIPKFIELGMNASGSWIASLQARESNGNGEIWGKDYTYYLVNGRAPGNRPPIDPLVKWVGYKLGQTGPEVRGIAFAIANKIAAQGTSYYPTGTDLLEVLTSKPVTDFVYSQIAIGFRTQISQTIRNDLKRIFTNG